ncbi:hypothetical protein PV10_01584 [Exophiala mesophila]|uniref:GrpE protein homolog, mitochondrial n=1 Tax=Exophiala mesophila TaxID=212818 RepID=A0A0D1ZV78_EXOME|nr:uncharacterized protein PV10_01584 [Exophiala mesophila]KIV97884.1 hypothetical protein PV10_01584 [Exophiala mesophila]
MLRKQLLRQSRAVSEAFTSTSASSLPQLRRAHFSSSPLTASLRPSPSSTLPSRWVSRRYQSTDAEKKTQEETPATDDAKSPEQAKEDAHKAELEKKNKEIIDLKDKYLRSVADYRNLQDRTKRDMDSARQFAIQKFAADLLESIDNLDRALTAVPDSALGKSDGTSTTSTESTGEGSSSTPDKDLVALHSGLRMTEEILLNTLKKHGLERFDPTEGSGRKFDPNTDEATFFTKVDGKEDGDVFFVQSKGFKLNGRVIRAAKVGVVKNS